MEETHKDAIFVRGKGCRIIGLVVLERFKEI